MNLQDSHGRVIRKLRVSLLDACNFRCFYCMPVDARFASASRYLSLSALFELCEILVNLGVEQIRVTGGEPTLRKEFREIMTGLSELPLQKFGMTTNGYNLQEHLPFLKSIGCMNLNVSLDSLDKGNFQEITRSKYFQETYKGILSAKDMGFGVKVNTVMVRGVNDHELLNFVRFSEKYDIEVRFLELMKIGQACRDQQDQFVSADEMISALKKTEVLKAKSVDFDSTSFNFTTEKGAKLGFIASESKPFCGSCSRLRLSYDGFLRACLMSNEGLSLKGLTKEQISIAVLNVMKLKPTGRISHINQDMNQIGG
ncbi:MAG: GTP 3',8-cyclase MoaA [Bdellovibrionales bacterium]|nr:GTP 3',8-cyclase MoaA [Bdellovibrionales bacterium]